MKTYNLIQILRSPDLMVRNSIFFRYINKLYSFFMLVFFRKLKKIQIEKYYTSSGTLKIFTKNQVYKVGSCYGDLQLELNNLHIIKKQFSELADYLLPQKVSSVFIFLIIESKRCYPHEQIAPLFSGIKMLEQLKQYSHTRQLTLSEFPTIQQGLKLLKILFPDCTFSCEMEKILSRKWRVGPTHGDFHLGNILHDENHSYVIDWDNFNCVGLQVLDAFSLWVDYHVKRSGLSWQAVILRERDQKIEDEKSVSIREFFDHEFHLIAFLYIVNRIGYENRYYKLLSRSVLNDFTIILTISKTIMEHEYGS